MFIYHYHLLLEPLKRLLILPSFFAMASTLIHRTMCQRQQGYVVDSYSPLTATSFR